MDEMYRVRKGRIAMVDVPELGYLSIQGRGVPDGPEFRSAARLLRAVTTGTARRMPIEALWWVDEAALTELIGNITWGRTNRVNLAPDSWRWQALLRAPDPAAGAAIAAASDRIRYLSWTEGPCAQVLHIGPYPAEGPSVLRLQRAIAAAGCRPSGRHHEIYLSERPAAHPERMATLLRQPVEAVREATKVPAGQGLAPLPAGRLRDESGP